MWNRVCIITRAHARLVMKAGNCQQSEHRDNDKGHRLPIEGACCQEGVHSQASEEWRAIASRVIIRTTIKGHRFPSKWMHAQASEAWRAIANGVIIRTTIKGHRSSSKRMIPKSSK